MTKMTDPDVDHFHSEHTNLSALEALAPTYQELCDVLPISPVIGEGVPTRAEIPPPLLLTGHCFQFIHNGDSIGSFCWCICVLHSDWPIFYF